MFAGPIVFAVFLVTSSLAEETFSNDVAQEKRAPMGFQGTRGKKNLISSENDEYSKRAPMGFQGMRGKRIMIGPDIEDNFLFENSDKRAPSMGFQGMRGKKEYLVPAFEDPFNSEEYEKRASMMGFQGMRGKKTVSDEDFNKRGPMGFQGVRGKKSFEEILEDMEKRAIMGFHGMRGKKTYDFEYPEEYEKRASAMGFQGTRGRRQDLEDWEKRAPMGFQGMRGKKNSLDEVQELHKRAVMGFQGVRGKRNVENSHGTSSELTNRAALNFEGSMRNREDSASYHFEKRSPYRYLGTRGKKNPRWGIRGKFVGVRGKKWESSPQEDRIQLKKLFDNIERLNRMPGSTSILAHRGNELRKAGQMYEMFMQWAEWGFSWI